MVWVYDVHLMCQNVRCTPSTCQEEISVSASFTNARAATDPVSAAPARDEEAPEHQNVGVGDSQQVRGVRIQVAAGQLRRSQVDRKQPSRPQHDATTSARASPATARPGLEPVPHSSRPLRRRPPPRHSLELLLPLVQAYGVPFDDLVGAPVVGAPRIRLKPQRVKGRAVIPSSRHPVDPSARRCAGMEDRDPDLEDQAGTKDTRRPRMAMRPVRSHETGPGRPRSGPWSR